MEEILLKLKGLLDGGVLADKATRRAYSHDASIFELEPDAVITPKHSRDVQRIVKFVNEHKPAYPTLAITPRGAGTDMTGAAIGTSLVLDMTKHMDDIRKVSPESVHIQPGTYVRDIKPSLDKQSLMLGSTPASGNFCTVGGMVGNNSGGEQSLRYGNTEHWVRQLNVVLADGKEYVVRPLKKRELSAKMKEDTFEGRLYKELYELIEENYDLIKNARPKLNKHSMGYNLWSVWDRDTGIFDMTRLFTGSQGTLGVITDIHIEPVKKATYSGLILAYVKNIKQLDTLIPDVMKHKPATFEGFDDVTFNLGVRYFNTFRKQLGAKEFLKQQTALLGSLAKLKGSVPNVVLLIGFDGDDSEEVLDKIDRFQKDMKKRYPRVLTEIEGAGHSSPFWHIRRSSFNLLRQKTKDKYAAPFMDDLTVQTRYIPVFLPQVRKIIKKYKIPATLSGHFGDGNFHILPLMDVTSNVERRKFEPAMRELAALVIKYKGTLAGEHNDGLIRGPWLPAMFGQEVYQIFREVKFIFDPQNIFNPHQKTEASWHYSMDHIRRTNKA
ncbi:MAG TPA: FAD-binding oxidoreductase [Candidatus Saccharibacteria bacterium]|nr:FAD-binding oxidoreductase [Candidatus Saccharibacteria bacterium]